VLCDVTGRVGSGFGCAPRLLRAHGAPSPEKCVQPRAVVAFCGVGCFLEGADAEGARCGVDDGERSVRAKRVRPAGVTRVTRVLAATMLATAELGRLRETSGCVEASGRRRAAWEGVRRISGRARAGAETVSLSLSLVSLAVDCRQWSVALPGPQVFPATGSLTRLSAARCSLLHQNLCRALQSYAEPFQSHSPVAMAKSSSKRPETAAAPLRKGDKGFIAVDKKAIDPSLASLFASSVRSISPRRRLLKKGAC